MKGESNTENPITTELATIGGGCFWCVDAVFERIKGVKKVTCGYAGGTTEAPTYKEVCSGKTGHAEVIQIEFDPAQVSYSDVLKIFWQVHDPTTPNQQGADVGTQYRSIILYHSPKQKEAADQSKQEAAKDFDKPIVTEIVALKTFFKAEDYHQDFYRNNTQYPYCQMVISPKLKKLDKVLSPK